MFRIEEAKAEVDSKRICGCKALVEQDWWDRLVGREMACAACRLVPRRWQMAETTGARGVCAKRSNPSNLHKVLHKSLLSFELMFESVEHREPRFVIPNEATGK